MGRPINSEQAVAPRLLLQDILPRSMNNFDLVRLVAACVVIAGHSFYLFPTNGWREPVTMVVERNFSGTLAVGVFFFLSGILITRSFQSQPTPLRFALLRVARIYPGALVCLLLMTFLIGPLATTLPLADYLTDQRTWRFLNDNWQLTHLVSRPAHCTVLPGVFAGNHYAVGPNGIGPLGAGPNGSLWTLYPEIAAYTYVLVLGTLGCLRTTPRILATAVALLLLHEVVPQVLPEFSDTQYSDTLKVGVQFLAGAVAYALRRHIVLRPRYFVLLALAAAALHGTFVQEYAMYLALFYGVLVFASAGPVRRLRLPGDYSFGVYLYGFPIQQSLQNLFPELTSYPSNLLALPLALLAGFLSWTLVEKPVLALAHRWHPRLLLRKRETSGLSTHET